MDGLWKLLGAASTFPEPTQGSTGTVQAQLKICFAKESASAFPKSSLFPNSSENTAQDFMDRRKCLQSTEITEPQKAGKTSLGREAVRFLLEQGMGSQLMGIVGKEAGMGFPSL